MALKGLDYEKDAKYKQKYECCSLSVYNIFIFDSHLTFFTRFSSLLLLFYFSQ